MDLERPQEQTGNPLNCFSIIKPIASDRNPIYHAYDTKSQRHVVLKTFPLQQDVNQTYFREKNYLTSLNHPSIIQLYEAVDITTSRIDSSVEKKISYIALEYASHGDLLEIITKHGHFSEILARTLFHQLIDALSYLHRRNIAHMDLKVDNLLIDENFKLKVIDFDLSQYLDASFLEARGTPGYRAPEVKNGLCGNLRAADVYSAAVVLFIMVCGHPPYLEHSKEGEAEYDAFYRLYRKNAGRFWEVHAKHKNNPDFFSEDFKELVNHMLKEEPRERASIEDIQKTKWYTGPVLSKEEFEEEMGKYLQQN